MMQNKLALSFGVIPLCKTNEGYQVLVVRNKKGGHWGFPKGTPEDNEAPLETAKRELKEETGIGESIRIEDNPLFHEKYVFEQNGITYHKTNTFYLGYVNEMSVGDHLDEIIEAKWASFTEAKSILSYPETIEVLKEISSYLSK